MFKRSLKYFAIAIVNAIILTVLLYLWTDKLELIFNLLVLPLELLKIIAFTFLSLLTMRLLIFYFRSENITSVFHKIKLASIWTLVISSYLYLVYIPKIIDHLIINKSIRERTAKKIEGRPSRSSEAKNLTIEDYQFIRTVEDAKDWFPEIPKEAKNISYNHFYELFLPDFGFSLSYDVPKEITVDTINIQKRQYHKYQNFKIEGNYKHITYSEGSW